MKTLKASGNKLASTDYQLEVLHDGSEKVKSFPKFYDKLSEDRFKSV